MNTVPTNVYAQDASNPNKSNSKIIPFPFLSFASHNVRSFTNTAKQHTLIEHYLSLNIDAIGLQETNFLSQHIRHSIMNIHLTSWVFSVLIQNITKQVLVLVFCYDRC